MFKQDHLHLSVTNTGLTECDTHSPNEASYQDSDGYRVHVKLETSCLDSSPEAQHSSHLSQTQQLTHASMASMAYSQPSLTTSKAPPYSVNGISLSAPNMDLIHPAMGYHGDYGGNY